MPQSQKHFGRIDTTPDSRDNSEIIQMVAGCSIQKYGCPTGEGGSTKDLSASLIYHDFGAIIKLDTILI